MATDIPLGHVFFENDQKSEVVTEIAGKSGGWGRYGIV